MDDEAIKIDDRKVLETLRFQESIRVKNDIELTAEFDIDFNDMIYRLEKSVGAEHLADDTYTGYSTCEHPQSTWQMFKHANQTRWWMRRFVRRWPVRMDQRLHRVTVQIGRYVKYPDAKVPHPMFGRQIPYDRIREL